MSKLGGTLEMLKKDAKNSKGTFDSYQNVFIQEREELLGIIKMKVSYFLVQIATATLPTDVKSKIDHEFNELKTQLEQSYKEGNVFKQMLMKLKEEIIGDEQEKTCRNCHQCFHPRLNRPDSCLYHPGKIKFYSCKYD